jgi:hypothetical protein
MKFRNRELETNNELVQVVRVLVSLSMWLGVRFLAHAYRENLVGRGESIFYGPQVSRRRLVIANGSRNFVPDRPVQ